MAIVDIYTVQSYLGITDGDDDGTIKILHAGIEAEISRFCDNRTFDSTAYFELYDGNGKPYLRLNQWPVTAVVVAANREDAIKIKNTTNAINAYVTIDTTNLTLTLVGTGSSDLAIATYTTLTTMVDAINAVGSGWSAEVYKSDYDSYPTSYLLPTHNKYCGSFGNTTPGWTELQMIDEPYDDYEVYEDEGRLYRSSCWPRGVKNLPVKYTGGYSTMPDDLKQVVLDMVEYAWDQKSSGFRGVKSYTIEEYSVTYNGEDVTSSLGSIPDRLSYFKRVKF